MSYNINSGYGQEWLGIKGAGKVFHVCPSGTSIYNMLADAIVPDPDGVLRLYGADLDEADVAIQAALDACVADRNDYVIVWPSSSDYDITAELSMSKKAVHLICPAGLGRNRGAGNGARIEQTTAASSIINITGNNCEVAGFYFKNYSKICSIEGGAAAHCAHIHHNHFNLTGATTGNAPAIDFATAPGAVFIVIENNYIATNVAGLTHTSIIDVEGPCTWANVSNNTIIIGDGCTATVGIQNLAFKGQTNDNYIAEVAAAGGASAGTVTLGISASEGGIIFNNRIATSSSSGFTGGGTYGFQGNTDHTPSTTAWAAA